MARPRHRERDEGKDGGCRGGCLSACRLPSVHRGGRHIQLLLLIFDVQMEVAKHAHPQDEFGPVDHPEVGARDQNRLGLTIVKLGPPSSGSPNCSIWNGYWAPCRVWFAQRDATTGRGRQPEHGFCAFKPEYRARTASVEGHRHILVVELHLHQDVSRGVEPKWDFDMGLRCPVDRIARATRRRIQIDFAVGEIELDVVGT